MADAPLSSDRFAKSTACCCVASPSVADHQAGAVPALPISASIGICPPTMIAFDLAAASALRRSASAAAVFFPAPGPARNRLGEGLAKNPDLVVAFVTVALWFLLG